MANKKINQLVLKTTIQSTDLFPLGDPTTGQLFKKTVAELQAAIGGAVISVNGLVGTVVLDTDDIQELASPTNKYFTEARARAAISLTTTGNSGASTYSNSTGVLNVPTYTLAGLGGITASFLSGGTGITYNSSTGVIAYSGTVYTDSSIRALFSAGTGISYNSSTGAISYSGTVYTDSSIRALISLTTSGSSGASTYNNTTGVLNVPTYTLAGLGGISLTSLSGSAPITYNSSTGAIGITQASTSADGYLSSTDWNTFNGKQSALTLGNLTESTSSVLTITGGTGAVVGSGTSIQVKQASSTISGFLSSTDWNTFNNKQGTITLTTTGTSGAATFSGGTLNIPQYQAVLTNPVTGTGTTNYVTKWTSSSAIGNSLIFDNGTNVGIGSTTFYNVQGAGQRTLTLFSSSGTALELVRDTSSDGFGNGEISWINSHNSSGNQGIAAVQVLTAGTSTNKGGVLQFLTKGNGTSGVYQERMRIASDGNVSMTGTLHVGGSLMGQLTGDNAALFKVVSGASTSTRSGIAIKDSWNGTNNTGSYIYFFVGTGSGEREAIRITNGGNIGINNTNPDFGNFGVTEKIIGISSSSERARFHFQNTSTGTGGVAGTLAFFNGSTQLASMDVIADGATNRGYYQWNINNGSGNNERMRLNSNGNLLIGTPTDNGERLYVGGSIRATGSITANSDARLKKNIERIENALEKVGQISGYTYNTIYDEDRHAGVIAQEIDKVLPEIVNKGNDGLMGVEYGNISALLIEAIKEQKVLIESLQAKVEALSK